MTILISGLIIFFVAHLFAITRSRTNVPFGLSEGPYKGLFSLASLLGFVLIVYGFHDARPSTLIWSPPIWARHIALLLVPISMVILVSAYTPLGYIKKTLKHPMLASVKLWALAHIFANGELNSMLLFLSFLAFGVMARIAAKRRGDNGPDGTPALTGDILAVVMGLAVSAAIIFDLHARLFGVTVT